MFLKILVFIFALRILNASENFKNNEEELRNVQNHYEVFVKERYAQEFFCTMRAEQSWTDSYLYFLRKSKKTKILLQRDKPSKKIIFIFGAQRSGTTLLQGLMSGTPQTEGMTSECYWMYSLLVKKNLSLYSWVDWAILKNEINNSIAIHHPHTDINKKLVLKTPIMTNYTFSRIILNLFNKEFIFVCILRNPLAIISSNVEGLKKIINTGSEAEIFEKAFEEILIYDYFRSIEKLKNHKNILFVKYEDLVLKKREIFEIINQHCGIQMNTQDYNEKNFFDGLHQEGNRWYSSLYGQPITDSSIDKYKKILSRGQIEFIIQTYKTFFEMFYPEELLAHTQ